MTVLPSDVRKAIYVVDTSRAGEILEEGLGFAPQGRKSALTPRLFLIGAILSIQSRRHLVVAEIYRTLVEDIDRDLQIELGVVDRATGEFLISEKAMERFSARLSERLEYGEGSAPGLDSTERERRRAKVKEVGDALLAPTKPKRKSSALALDGSGTWAWAKSARKAPTDVLAKDSLVRQEGKDEQELDLTTLPQELDTSSDSTALEVVVDDTTVPQSYDRDANWGVKTSKDGQREAVFWYEIHALTRVPDMGQDNDLEPNLIEAIDVTPAGRDIVDPSLRLIDGVIASGESVKELLADRHYSYKLPTRWAFQLAARGIEQVVDLHKHDQGFRDYNGAKLAAATPHCPGTPDYLGVINHPGPASSREQLVAFSELIAIREQYAFQRITIRDRRRFMCPALAGKVGCPLRKGTVEAAVAGDRLVILNPPEIGTAPACCTQKTIEVKEDGQPKLWQKEYWGSKHWQLSMNRRTYVEGVFGNLKNPSTENLTRGFFRITGQARVTLFVGIAATAHNMRQLSNWHERTGNGDPTQPLLAPDSTTFQVHLTPEEYEALKAHREADTGFGTTTREEPGDGLDEAA